MTKRRDIVSVEEHAFRIGEIVRDLNFQMSIPTARQRSNTGDYSSWSNVADWLDLSSSVEEVAINTTRFDDQFGWCRGADEHELRRSDLYKGMATELAKFMFSWMALEACCQLINPPNIDPQLGVRSNSLVDRTIFYLKRAPTIPEYTSLLGQFSKRLLALPLYKKFVSSKLRPHVGAASQGLDVVRRIRNTLAHGLLSLPIPNDRSQRAPEDSKLIHLSTRIVLYTIQTALVKFTRDTSSKVALLKDEDGMTCETDVVTAFALLHLRNVEFPPVDVLFV